MTREIKEADSQVKKEIMEERKHSEVVGLEAGEVMEPFVGSVGDALARTGFEGGSSNGSGGRGRALSSKQSCQELKQPPEKQQQRVMGTSISIPNTVSAKKEPVEALSPTPAAEFSMKRTWVVRKRGSNSDGARKGGSATTESEAAPSRPKRSRGDRELTSEAGGDTGQGKMWGAVGEERAQDGAADGLPKCEFGDCSKVATFGVNGIVRYW